MMPYANADNLASRETAAAAATSEGTMASELDTSEPAPPPLSCSVPPSNGVSGETVNPANSEPPLPYPYQQHEPPGCDTSPTNGMASGGGLAAEGGGENDGPGSDGGQGALHNNGEAAAAGGDGDFGGSWTVSTVTAGDRPWGADEGEDGAPTAAASTAWGVAELRQSPPAAVVRSVPSHHPSAPAPAAAAAAPRPIGYSASGPPAAPLSAEALAAAARVAFPGDGAMARVWRGIVDLLRDRPRYHPMGLAELGGQLRQHHEAGPALTDPATPLPKLREVVEAAAAAAPGVLVVERNELNNMQVTVTLNGEALRLVALRRAVAAAYPGGDDVSLVRRAAAAALVAADPVAGVRHSLNMPSLGLAVIQAASEPRQRLAKARGSAFSLAAVLTDRGPAAAAANGRDADAADSPAAMSYIAMSTVGTSRVARLDAERLLADAAAGRFGDLTAVQPVVPKAAVNGPAVVGRSASPPALHVTAVAATGPAAVIAPVVKDALRAAVPEGRPSLHAKRCLALLAAASLGAQPVGTVPPDPPHTLRSSPCGVVLHDLDLQPPKGQMRALFDEEPHLFRAGKPSPNYLIELVYEPLLQLAASHPEQVAASVAALLQGRTYVGLRLREPGARVAEGAAAAPPSAAAGSLPTAISSSRFAGGAQSATAAAAVNESAAAAAAPGSSHHGSASLEPPRGQPPDYYVRLERALNERLEANGAVEFLTRARRVVAEALLRRNRWSGGPAARPPYAMSIKDVATLLKHRLPEAYASRRPPGVFPVNALVLAQQLPLVFIVDKPGSNPKDWSIRLNINSLELSAGLNPTKPPERDAAAATAAAESSSEDPADTYDYYAGAMAPPPAVAAAATPEPEPPETSAVSAAEVVEVLRAQPARALAAALAPTIPPDLLQEPVVRVITVPYSAEYVTALTHCMSCPQIGLATKSVGGLPALVLLYAPAVDSLKPAAAAAAGATPAVAPPTGVLPASVYVLDASAATAVSAGSGGGSGDVGAVLLSGLRVLLEDPGVAKVVHGCEQLVPALEHSVGCVISPLLDTRLVSEMLRPLDLNPRPAPGPEEPPKPDDGSAPELWPLPSNWQAALTMKYWDYHVAAVQHASGADSAWLHRPLTDSKLGMLVRAVQHLPELWSALTWLLPRLAQFCSIARAQQCRAMLGPMDASAEGQW